MISKIVVFNGCKRDFEVLLNNRIREGDITIPFMDLIQHYNARLRPNESGVGEEALYTNIEVDNCVVKADDYGSVLEHVLSNFVNILTLNHNIGTLFVQNPPKRVLNSLEAYSEEIEYLGSDYRKIDRDCLKEVYLKLDKDILGQNKCKKQIISGLYKLIAQNGNKPIVLMLYGPSGVGKTETAKSVSRTLGGELLRIQFSMMVTEEAYNYVFGAEHSKNSFAKDMLGRESDVILIDEFDKVNPTFYNAFYELFDEGRYVDSNYRVDLKNTIFLCTCNYMDEDEIKKNLGPAMFSRIGCCIEFAVLGANEKQEIIDNYYNQLLSQLEDDEKQIIQESDILDWFKSNLDRFDNIRLLKTRVENAIFDKLSETIVLNETANN